MFIGCISQNNLDITEVPKCCCNEGDITVYYRSSENFEDITPVLDEKMSYVKVFLRGNLNDTLSVLFNNNLILENYCRIDANDLHGVKEIYYNYSNDKSRPILTIKSKFYPKDCLQLVVDTRYKLMFVNKIDDSWFVTYSNFYTEVY